MLVSENVNGQGIAQHKAGDTIADIELKDSLESLESVPIDIYTHHLLLLLLLSSSHSG